MNEASPRSTGDLISVPNSREGVHQKAATSSLLIRDARSLSCSDTSSVHTPVMTLKNAALLALIGTILMTAPLVWVFVSKLVNVLRGGVFHRAQR